MIRICLFCIFFITFQTVAQTIDSFERQISLKQNSRSLMHKQAIEYVSKELIIDMIGLEKFQKQEQVFLEIISKQANRYILFAQSSKIQQDSDGNFNSIVKLKASKNNLKKLLLDHNLFYKSQGSFCLIPFISFTSYLSQDKPSRTWWMPKAIQHDLLKPAQTAFFNQLNKTLILKGFYSLNPVFQKISQQAPSSLLSSHLNLKNFTALARFYSCDLALIGKVQFGQESDFQTSSVLSKLFSLFKGESHYEIKDQDSLMYFTNFDLSVFNLKTNRVLFKIQKKQLFLSKTQVITGQSLQAEINQHIPNILSSLTYQLSFYQNKGTLESKTLTINLQGRLTYLEKEQLKQLLIHKTSSIKSLEKQFITSDYLVYLAESSKNVKTIINELNELNLSKFHIQASSYKKNTIQIYAKKRVNKHKPTRKIIYK